MTGAKITHAGAMDFKERDMVLGLARWCPKAPDVNTVVPMQKFLIANAGMNIMVHQYVARHKDFQGGRPVLFADQVTIGRQVFIQFLIKPLMYPMTLQSMDGDAGKLQDAFEIIVKTGVVVAIVSDVIKPPADGPILKANFKD